MDMHRKYNENTEEIQAKYRVKTGEKNRGDTGGKTGNNKENTWEIQRNQLGNPHHHTQILFRTLNKSRLTLAGQKYDIQTGLSKDYSTKHSGHKFVYTTYVTFYTE